MTKSRLFFFFFFFFFFWGGGGPQLNIWRGLFEGKRQGVGVKVISWGTLALIPWGTLAPLDLPMYVLT